MELRIYNPQDDGFIQKIEWNFEELKNEITVASEEYAVSVYTDDAIKAAKALSLIHIYGGRGPGWGAVLG